MNQSTFYVPPYIAYYSPTLDACVSTLLAGQQEGYPFARKILLLFTHFPSTTNICLPQNYSQYSPLGWVLLYLLVLGWF